MEQSMEKLRGNTIVSLIRVNEKGEFLVCKQEVTENRISLPTIVINKLSNTDLVNPWKDYASELINIMEFDFGIRTKKLSFLTQCQNRTAYKLNNEMHIGDHLCYVVEEVPSYKGKLPPINSPSGLFNNEGYMSYADIESKFKKGEFDSNAFVFLFEFMN
ncbi:MAG: hypothetical protein ACRC5F_06000, partial [Cetobacterium sp.]